MIPEMDDPLGKYWRQPANIREAPMDDEVVLLTPAQFDGLASYETTTPSGVYPGKCWKARKIVRRGDALHFSNEWYLRWYGIVPDNPKMCSNNQRLIMVVT